MIRRILGRALIALAFACVAFTVAAPFCFSGPAHAADGEHPPPLCNTNPCLIGEDDGGYLDEYAQLAARLKATGWRIHIDGPCYSACTVLADLARPQVCIGRHAAMLIHQAEYHGTDEGRREPIAYSKPIAAWIKAHGGQPTVGFLKMSRSAALKFWRAC